MSDDRERGGEQSGTESQPGASEKTDATQQTRVTKLSRLERLAAARAEHRRKMATRLWYAAIPVVLVIVVVVALLSVFGRFESGDPAPRTTITLAPEPDAGSGLLFIEQDDALLLAVLLQPREKGGAVLSMPGITLVKSGTAFRTLADLYAAGATGALAEALSDALAVLVGPEVSVGWSELRRAMTSVGVSELPAGALTGEEREAEVVAQALLAFVTKNGSERGAAVWDALELGGDSAGFRDAVSIDATSISTTAWTAAVLTGRLVEGEGFKYLEPELEEARTLLSASSAEALISVEVQDGAGVVGAAEQADSLLEAAGYALLPMSYSEDFPNVELTRIAASPDLIEDAEQIRELLGAGEIGEDESLEANHIVVLLGKDFIPPSPAETEPSG
jgi:hypothetical protein